ncbi:MAG: helix-turn-helix transcriptional regulator [Bacteroidota bacterium]
MKLNEIVKTLREKHGYTQEYLGNILNISPSAVGKLENGIRKLQAAEMLRLSQLFGMSADEFANYGEPMGQVSEPEAVYEPSVQKSVTLVIELDGKERTLEYWISTLRRVNEALDVD